VSDFCQHGDEPSDSAEGSDYLTRGGTKKFSWKTLECKPSIGCACR
jgi:hypothetical protein